MNWTKLEPLIKLVTLELPVIVQSELFRSVTLEVPPAAVSAAPCTVELSMMRLSVEPPLTFSHCPLFTIAVEPHLR